jgi:hypothetical protein
VRDAEAGCYGVGEGMGGAEHGILDGRAGEVRAQQHASTGIDVVRVLHHAGERAGQKIPRPPREQL